MWVPMCLVRHVYRHDLTPWYQQVSVQNADDLFRRKERSCLNFPYKSNYVTSQEYLAFASQLVQLNSMLHMTNGCTFNFLSSFGISQLAN